MSTRGPRLVLGPTRFLMAVASAVLLLAPSISALDHELLHAAPSAPVHDEAAHPNAAPHLDLEEHSDLHACLGCLAGGKAIDLQARWSELGALDAAPPTGWSAAPIADLFRLTGPPRAPPL